MKLAQTYRKTGDVDAEAFHTLESDFLYEKGKRDLIEIGRSPEENDKRVQGHLDDIDNELQSAPTKMRNMLYLCNEHFPERANRPRSEA
ncbi:hypothetical protein GGE12_007340 [Rhizobium mongolense]|uniref:Uncharacterized protein n=1 Tax=Rhizobium mongolense TaxID=57676 RepID=A0A7W6RVW8_9HYPH|nr:hypothetical protein [Rhizobium mongolense]